MHCLCFALHLDVHPILGASTCLEASIAVDVDATIAVMGGMAIGKPSVVEDSVADHETPHWRCSNEAF